MTKLTLPNTDIESWFAGYGTNQRADYGLEFLTTISDGIIEAKFRTDHPRKTLEDTLWEKAQDLPADKRKSWINQRKNRIIRDWREGSIPRSVKVLNELREMPGSEFYIDMFKHPEGIPYSHPVVASLAYLAGSIICGGYIGGAKDLQGQIHLPRNNDIREKIGPILSGRENDGDLGVKSCYLRILTLIGMAKGPLVEAEPEELGIEFLRDPSKEVAKRFVESFVDHRLKGYSPNTVLIDMPHLRKRQTAQYLRDIFQICLHVSNYLQNYHDGRVRRVNHPRGRYYRTEFRFPKERFFL